MNGLFFPHEILVYHKSKGDSLKQLCSGYFVAAIFKKSGLFQNHAADAFESVYYCDSTYSHYLFGREQLCL